MTGRVPFVRLNHQLQMGDALHGNGPLLALKRRAWWAKGVLLAQQGLVGLPPVARDRHLDLLRTAYIPFLDLEAELAQGLRGIEGQEQPLWSRRPGDPAAPPRATVAVEDVVNRIIGGLRSHPHSRECRDVFFSWLSDSRCWMVCEKVFAQHDASSSPLRHWAGP